MARPVALRQRLRAGGRAYGPLLLGDSPAAAELLGACGYDFAVIDHEHGPTDPRSGQALLRALDAAAAAGASGRTEPLVRVPCAGDAAYVKKVLDGLRLPGGLVFPMVEDAAAARRAVRATRYPEEGVRGCAAPLVRATGYGLAESAEEYLRRCREELLVLVQVESPAAVEAIPEIAAVEGVDGIFLGPYDLSAALGKMGRFEDPEVRRLLARAEAKVRESGSVLAGFRSPGRELGEMFGECGYGLVVGAADLALLREAARLDAARGREAAKAAAGRRGNE